MSGVVGRYVLGSPIAAGGMATVHLARMRSAESFRRTVAVKRMHATFAMDPEFRSMFLDEARLASRVSHPSVVSVLDVVSEGDELLLVMEYVRGAALSRLLRDAPAVPVAVASAVLVDVLSGLDAAHRATDEHGVALEIVHRDVSPQNVLVGADGVARIIDFGIAKALGRSHATREGVVKGKAAYMAPEQIRGEPVDQRADVFACGVVAWEMLTGKRLFAADSTPAVINRVLERQAAPPSSVRADLPRELDAVVLQALEKDRLTRWASARELRDAIESCVPPASRAAVAAWVAERAADALREADAHLAALERSEDAPASVATIAPSADATDTLVERRRRWLAPLVAGLVVAGAGGAWLASSHARAMTITTASAPVVASTPASATTEIPTTSAPARASTMPVATTAPIAPATNRARHHDDTRCNPPFTVDKDGVRVPKRECF